MKFGHGLVVEAKRAWGGESEGLSWEVWAGRVVESVNRWCGTCKGILKAGDLVDVVEGGGKPRRFFHDRCLPRKFTVRWG